jgi:hypothetical protein
MLVIALLTRMQPNLGLSEEKCYKIANRCSMYAAIQQKKVFHEKLLFFFTFWGENVGNQEQMLEVSNSMLN